MKKLYAWAPLAALALAGLWSALAVWGEELVVYYIEPSRAFVAEQAGIAPDYRQVASWAAWPGKSSGATLSPAGETGRDGPAPVDVFFIHPTSYISGEAWNDPLDPRSRSWEMIDIILAAQASAFNLCCDVYAPHYRQATLWSFLDREGRGGPAALQLAYADIERAFRVFLKRNGERPFIIASHSQGTYHALRLLAEYLDGRALQQRMVAAYLVGYWLPMDTFGRTLKHIAPCESARDTGCVLHWSTYGEEGVRRAGIPHWYPDGQELADGKDLLCTNPLSWEVDGPRVSAAQHPGALYVSPGGNLLNTLLNTPAEVEVAELPPLLPHWTWAECREGLLRVAEQSEGAFAQAGNDPRQDYHLIDYNLFYEAVRENALLRSRSHAAQYLSGR